MPVKLACELDETFCGKRAACFIGGMIAPHSQRHSVARIREAEFAIRLLLAGKTGCHRFDLYVHTRLHGAILCGAPNFAERHQIHNSIYHSLFQTIVGIYAPIAEKWPMRSVLVYASPFHVGYHNLFPVHRGLGDNFAIRTTHKTLAPKFNSVATGRRFMTDPVCDRDVTTIRNRVTALDCLPRVVLPGAKLRLFLGMPDPN